MSKESERKLGVKIVQKEGKIQHADSGGVVHNCSQGGIGTGQITKGMGETINVEVTLLDRRVGSRVTSRNTSLSTRHVGCV
jgi:hypothetical protein